MASCNIRMRRLDNEEGRGEENRSVRDEMFKKDNANIVDGKTNKQMGTGKSRSVERKLLGIGKERKMKYFGHIMRKKGSCLEKEIIQGTVPGGRGKGRPRVNWMDNIRTWTGQTQEDLIRMTEDRRRWRNIVHDAAVYPRSEEG